MQYLSGSEKGFNLYIWQHSSLPRPDSDRLSHLAIGNIGLLFEQNICNGTVWPKYHVNIILIETMKVTN